MSSPETELRADAGVVAWIRSVLYTIAFMLWAVIACVGGGSNAIGMFADFIDETNVGLIGVEPAGHGIETGEHGAPLKHGRVGIYFGMKSPMMQTADGQIGVMTMPVEATEHTGPIVIWRKEFARRHEAFQRTLFPAMKPYSPDTVRINEWLYGLSGVAMALFATRSLLAA